MTRDPNRPPSDFIQSFADKLKDIFRDSPAKDIEHNLKAGVAAMLAKLDMVSREEFDVQAEVLARTRARLEVLEARLERLEQLHASSEPAPADPAPAESAPAESAPADPAPADPAPAEPAPADPASAPAADVTPPQK